jgi:hypothetical protein
LHVPVLLAVCAVVVALALAALVGQVSPLSFFVVNMLIFMGLAVGIDYSLFIISRYREERGGGRSQLDASRRARCMALDPAVGRERRCPQLPSGRSPMTLRSAGGETGRVYEAQVM